MGATVRAARKAKAAAQSVKKAVYWVGVVTEVTSTTRCRVAYGDKEVPCVIPQSLKVSVEDQVQIRVLGNDYTISAVLTGEKQAAWVAETAETAASTATSAQSAADLAQTQIAAAEANILAAGNTAAAAQAQATEAIGKAEQAILDAGDASDAAASAASVAAAASSAAAAAQTVANTAQATASGKNRITYSTSDPSNYAGQIAGDAWFKYSGTTLIGWWRATSATAWAAQTLAETWLPQVNIGTGTYGSLSGSRLEAATVLASTLILSDFTNPVDNSGFETGDLTGWAAASGTILVNATVPHGGLYKAFIPATLNTTLDLRSTNLVTVAEGDVWVLTVWAATDATGTSAAASIGLQLNGAESNVSMTIPANNSNTWTRYTYTYTVPAGVRTIRARMALFGGTASVAGNLRVDDVSLRRANGAELIVDGSITTSKLVATAIDGMTVTGAILQTTATASRGVKLTSGGLVAYNGSGTATLTIDGSTGAIAMLGALTSGSTVTGATVTGGTVQTTATASRGVKLTSGGLVAYNSSGVATLTIDASTGAISMLGALTSGSTITGAVVTGGTVQTAATGRRVVLDATQNALVAYGSDGSDCGNLTGSDVAGTTKMTLGSPGDIYIVSVGNISLQAASGRTDVSSQLYCGDNIWAKPSTASSAANAVWSSATDGYRRLNFNSSLRRYKANIEDAENGPALSDPAAVLRLRSRRWFDKGEISEHGLDPETATVEECLDAGLRWVYGFVAEEVEAAGLDEFCHRENGELIGVTYDRITVGLLHLARAQTATIDALDRRLTALEAA